MKNEVFKIDTSNMSEEKLEEFRKAWIEACNNPLEKSPILNGNNEPLIIKKDGTK